MTAKTRHLRELLDSGDFLYMPSAATPLEGRLAEAIGTPLVYTGGYVTGASRMITEPLLTMDEQVRVAGEVARAVTVPLVADAGAGFGEPLHTCARCGSSPPPGSPASISRTSSSRSGRITTPIRCTRSRSPNSSPRSNTPAGSAMRQTRIS